MADHASIPFAYALILAAASQPALAAQTQAHLLFRTDFSHEAQGEPIAPPWHGGGGTFVVTKGRLHIKSLVRQNVSLRLERELEGDLRVSARLRRADKIHWCGMIVKTVYQVTVNNQFGTMSVVRVMKNGKRRTLATTKSWRSYVKHPDHFLMQVAAAEGVVTVWLDGHPAAEARDEEMPETGTIGFLGGWGTDLLVDDVEVLSLEDGPPPEPPAPLQVTDARTGRPDAIYHDGEAVPVKLCLANLTGQGRAMLVRLRLLDFWERAREVCVLRVAFPPAGECRVEQTFDPGERGVFKVAVDVGDVPGNYRWVADALSFSVIPRAVGETPPNPDSPFGLHCEQINAEQNVAVGRKIGAKWCRGHDVMQHTYWYHVEKEKGKFTWVGDGRNQKVVDEAGLQFLGMFAFTPHWASSAPAHIPRKWVPDRSVFGFYPPRNWDDFASYVGTMVDHYRQVRAWEVWNEPFLGGFWHGTVAQYVKCTEAAYKAAKRAAPDCTVIGGGGQSLASLGVIEEMLKLGLGTWMDAFSIHGYIDAVEPMDPAALEGKLPELRSLLRKYGANVPIWNTESGINTTSFLDQHREGYSEPEAPYHFREAAYRLTRMLVTNIAADIKRCIYYANWARRKWVWTKWKVRNSNLVEGNGALKPMGVAYATTAYLLERAKFVRRGRHADLVASYIFERGADAIGVHWGLFGKFHLQTVVEVELPPQVERGQLVRVDLMGNETPVRPGQDGSIRLPLSREPVFLWLRNGSASTLGHVYESVRLVHPIVLPREDDSPDEGLSQTDYPGLAQIPPDRWVFIDLRPHCNMSFADEAAGDGKGGWTDEGPFNDLRDLPVGKQKWFGVPFDVVDPAGNGGRSCIVLKSRHAPGLPAVAKNIKVGEQCLRRLFFLHSAGWGVHDPKVIYGRYVLHYEDGQQIGVPIRGLLDNANWWTPHDQRSEAKTVAIPISRSVRDDAKELYCRIRDFDNPRPDVPIASIDFVSSEGVPIPILIAVTGLVTSNQ